MTSPPREPEGDKRLTPRLDIERPVHIATKGDTRVACTLSDISKSGARLAVDNADAIPDEFELVLNNDLRRWCRVMRRSDKQIGVKFIAGPTPPEPVS